MKYDSNETNETVNRGETGWKWICLVSRSTGSLFELRWTSFQVSPRFIALECETKPDLEQYLLRNRYLEDLCNDLKQQGEPNYIYKCFMKGHWNVNMTKEWEWAFI